MQAGNIRRGDREWIATARYALALSVVLATVFQNSPALRAQAGFIPPLFVGGQLPVAPGNAVAGGQVYLEALVGDDGQVMAVRPLRITPGFTDRAISAVTGWRFQPASEEVAPIEGKAVEPKKVQGTVFVAAMFSPPAMLGPTPGQPPQNVGVASPESPMPTSAAVANYPVQGAGSGVVLIEVTIDARGTVSDSRVRLSSPGFDAVALSAAQAWAFRPARRQGVAVTGRAYLIFAFQVPVVGSPFSPRQ